ncbi:hypothetical protein SGCOL_008253 [Colletotrichum sp. CLE4]
MSPAATVADLKSAIEAKASTPSDHYKPAIYFLSPTRLNNVDVQVKISRHWSFSTIYPLAKGAVGQNNVSWQVSIKPDGTLKDTATDIDCSYLFWEAGALADPSSASIRDRGLQIAFNFIPQINFEKAAKLTVTPSPSSVARVLLVFRGVVGSKNAKNHAELDALDWPSKIGIEVEGIMNQSKFRVM